MREVAADPQTPSQTIYVWLRQDRVDAGLEPGLTSADQAELVTARRRIAQMETEPVVTKRAVDLVSEAVPPRRRTGVYPKGDRPGSYRRLAGEFERASALTEFKIQAISRLATQHAELERLRRREQRPSTVREEWEGHPMRHVGL